MNSLFKHTDLRFYVRFLFETAGIDVRYMVPDFDELPQAPPEVIEDALDTEDKQNADHMETHWLYYDRALEAIGMRESSGYNKSKNVEAWAENRINKTAEKEAYIGLARTNAERSKDFLNDIPLGMEITSNRDEDQATIRGLNRYRDEILNQNNWEGQKTNFIADGHDFGSGVMWNPYRESKAGRSDRRFLEERARQGQPIEYQEYQKFKDFAKSHVVEWVDTFDVLRDRRATGEESMDFSHRMHTITTKFTTMTVTEAMQAFPTYRDKITPGLSRIHRQINPKIGHTNHDDLLITKKDTWVQCPVRYSIDIPVHVGNNLVIPKKEWIPRTVVVRLERLEGCGIVDAHVDEYAHGEIPLTMWQRRPSKTHAYGIGAYKDMWAAEWAYNIAFNGKFHWFNRMAKGGGFYFKGTMGNKEINARTKEHTWVEIDPNSLPAHLRDKPISHMVQDTRPSSFPSVYDNLELSMEDKVNRTSGWQPSGQKGGTSGRQQMIMENSAQSGMGPTVKNLEMAFAPMADKFFDNIIQFDGETPIEFTWTDPVSGEKEPVQLNVPMGEVEMFDPETMEYKLFAYEVRNSIKSIEWSTQVSTRSLVPSNPTEQRFFWLDTLNSIFPYTQSEEGLAFLSILDKKVYGGLFTEMIERLQAVYTRNAQLQQQAIQAEERKDLMDKAQKREMDMIEAGQNKFRLEQKALSDLLKALAAFQDGNPQPLQDFTNNNQQLMNGVNL